MLQQGYAEENETACTLATLRGWYVFDAAGYDIVNSIPAGTQGSSRIVDD
jgi:hypothetical protein